MKTKATLLIALMLILGVGPIFAQHDHSAHMNADVKSQTPDTFKKQLNGVLIEYLSLKDALVASDESKARAAAKNTLVALEKVDMNLLSGDDHMKWMSQYKAIQTNLNGIVLMKGIDMKRSHFSVVSKNLSSAVQDFGVISSETIYVDYCPMASNNKGAYWLSAGKEIRNPYFGDKMLKCGEIKNTIN